jgi:ParB family chromosome partitioning protein
MSKKTSSTIDVQDPTNTILARLEDGADRLDQVIAPIEVDRLLPDPCQPRKSFNRIDELAKSMSEHGLQEALVIRPAQGAANRGKYWVVSGERRLRAAKELGWDKVDCRIKTLDPTKSAILALALNIHREDLSEIEKGESCKRIKTMIDGTWDEVAALVGISPIYARQLGSLLNVTDSVKERVRNGTLPTRTAIALKALPDKDQEEWAKKAVEEHLTAEQVRTQTQHLARPRMTRHVPDLQVPTRIEQTPVEAPVNTGRAGTKTKLLEDSGVALTNIRKLIERQSWSPSEVTPRQQELLKDLYREVAALHQEISDIYLPFRPDAKAEAKKLATALPF